jgi:hypothetical protein
LIKKKMAAAALLLLLQCAAVMAGGRDWVDAYDLSAHREAFDKLGLTAADLATLEEVDADALQQRMKKYERVRFVRAMEDARQQRRPRASTPAPQDVVLQHAHDARRALSTVLPAVSRADHESLLKEALLSGNATTSGVAYDKSVPPALAREYVRVGLNLYHVYAMDMPRSTVALHVWLRISWADERLAWNPADFGGVEMVTFVASPVAIEESQIWVPEVELYEGTMSSYDLPHKLVQVYANGSAYMSRPGEVSIVCSLTRLNNFPFDENTCPMRFGGW